MKKDLQVSTLKKIRVSLMAVTAVTLLTTSGALSEETG